MEVREPSAKYLPRAGYKQTEVGVIPEDWCEASLTSLTEKGSRITYGVVQPGKNDSDGVLFIRGGDIFAGRIIETKLRRIPKAIAEQYKRTCLSGGEILISLVGYPGEAALVPKSLAGANIARQVALVKLNKGLPNNPDFVCKFLQSDVGRRQLLKEAIGSAQQVINLRDIQKVTVALPPTKAEQAAIVEALSDADALIESLEQLLAKKRQIKQGAVQELLTGKKRLPGFSGEWVIKEIGQFTDCTAGGTPSTRNAGYWGGAIQWMSSGELNHKMVAEVEGRITEEGLRNSSTKMLPANCVLIGLAGQGKTRGTVAMNFVPLCTNQSIAAIFPNPSFVPEYLYFNLDSRYDELRELSAGDGGRGGLNLTIIRKIAVPFPSIEEQTAIAAILADMDAELAALEEKLAKARNLKRGMMQELLTGRIRLVKPGSNAVNARC
jgi:type I restriction enzyme S subunit